MRTAVRAPAASPEGRPFPQPLRLRLRRRVLSLGYPGCVALVGRLLGEMDYEDVRPTGRTRLTGYNRRGGGGWDLEAALPAGVGSRRVIVRVKHVPREHLGPDPKPVHNRCVDELRGACLRAGAAEAVMVSTGPFSLTARAMAAGDASGVAPVRLVDGDELVELLLARRVGVRETRPLLGRPRLELDESLFAVMDGLGGDTEKGAAADGAPNGKVAPRARAVPVVRVWVGIGTTDRRAGGDRSRRRR